MTGPITYASVLLPPEPGGDCTVFLYDKKGGKRLDVRVIPERDLGLELAGYTVEMTEWEPLVVRVGTRPRPSHADYRPFHLSERRQLAAM